MATRKKYFVGNWKMNKRKSELSDFFSQFGKNLKSAVACDVGFAVPSVFLENLAPTFREKRFFLGAQNFHWESSGAFTGELSIDMLLDAGATGALVGHSERRQYFGETDATVCKKVTAAAHKKFPVILCIGETLDERKSNKTNEVVKRQVLEALSQVQNLDFVTLAYEPVWAIGTGLSATSAQAQEVHKMIRGLLVEKFGAAMAEKTRILYGGSMNEKNFAELVAQPDIDGGLIGGASLKPDLFATICN